MQIHHNAAANRLVVVLTDEGQFGLAAHAPGAFKGDISVRAAAKIQGDALGPEHGFCLLLAGEIFLSPCPGVEDAAKIHVEDDSR